MKRLLLLPLLLLSACAAGDVTHKTQINSYTVPDSLTKTSYLDKSYANAAREWVNMSINSRIETESIPSYSSYNEIGRKYRLENLQRMKSSFMAAAKYAEKELEEQEAGMLSFTYIKTDINKTRSSHEKILYCIDADNTSGELHPIVKQLEWRQRLLASKGTSEFPSILDLVVDVSSNEDKELVALSRKLCKRYFGKDKGQFYMEDIYSRSIEVITKS